MDGRSWLKLVSPSSSKSNGSSKDAWRSDFLIEYNGPSVTLDVDVDYWEYEDAAAMG